MSFDNERIRLLREMDDWDANSLAQELYAIFADKSPAVFGNGISLDGSGANPPITLTNYTPGDTLLNVTTRHGDNSATISIQDGNLVVTTPAGPTINLNFGQNAGNPGGLRFTNVAGRNTNYYNVGGQPLGLKFTDGPKQGGININYKSGPTTGGDPIKGTDAGKTAEHINNPDKRSTTTKDNAASGRPDGEGGGGGGGGAFPGFIVSGSGNDYAVDVYFQGLTIAPTRVAVRQLQIAAGEAFSPGTAVAVFLAPDDTYFMQAPVWQA